jgi:hypothetical protein
MALFSLPRRVSAAIVVLGAVAASMQWTLPARADQLPANVRAVFDVNFNGINVGALDFTATADGSTYSVASTTRLSLLLGAVSWNGNSNASGRLVNGNARPAGFTFDFAGAGKSGSTRMGFTDDSVTSVVNLPKQPPRDGVVPILPQHLRGVLDPMSAVLAMSRGSADGPCGRRLPVFDGQMRFDLVLIQRGTVQLREQRPSGQPGTGYVCKVKFVPIAGHRMDDEAKFMEATDGIEVVLRPIPSANVYIPYKITVPTIAGSATLVSRNVEIVTSAHQQIALVH